MAEYRILAIGDIVGAESTDRVCRTVGRLRNEYRADLVIANGENAARGNGLDRVTAESLLSSGIDVLTSGNHIWQKHGMQDYIDGNRFVLRPANYPSGTPGKGFVVYDSCGIRVLVMNVLGTVFMEPLASPFETADAILEKCRGGYDVALVDFHAEATSEKLALARYLTGRVSAVWGTHTQVATEDCRILGGHKGFITDLGMVGSADGILGVKSEAVLHKFLVKTPVRFETEHGNEGATGALFTVDSGSGKCISAESVSF